MKTQAQTIEARRPKRLERGELYNRAEQFRRIAQGFVDAADELDARQAKLLRGASGALAKLSSDFDAEADATPVDEDSDLPFA
jgi:hypothetical protein